MSLWVDAVGAPHRRADHGRRAAGRRRVDPARARRRALPHRARPATGAVTLDEADAQARTDRDAGALLLRDCGSPLDTTPLQARDDLPEIIRAGRHLARPKRYIRGLVRRPRRSGAAARASSPSRPRRATAGSSSWGTGSTAGVGDLAPLWPDDVLVAAIDAAHAAGARVTAHVFGTDALPGLIDAGIDCIEHGTGLTDDLIAEMARRGTALVPTLINVETFPGIADVARRASRRTPRTCARCTPGRRDVVRRGGRGRGAGLRGHRRGRVARARPDRRRGGRAARRGPPGRASARRAGRRASGWAARRCGRATRPTWSSTAPTRAPTRRSCASPVLVMRRGRPVARGLTRRAVRGAAAAVVWSFGARAVPSGASAAAAGSVECRDGHGGHGHRRARGPRPGGRHETRRSARGPSTPPAATADRHAAPTEMAAAGGGAGPARSRTGGRARSGAGVPPAAAPHEPALAADGCRDRARRCAPGGSPDPPSGRRRLAAAAGPRFGHLRSPPPARRAAPVGARRLLPRRGGVPAGLGVAGVRARRAAHVVGWAVALALSVPTICAAGLAALITRIRGNGPRIDLGLTMNAPRRRRRRGLRLRRAGHHHPGVGALRRDRRRRRHLGRRGGARRRAGRPRARRD